MNTIRSHLLPSALLGACLALVAATYVGLALNWSTPGYERGGQETFGLSTWPALFLVYPVVGALIAARHPRNAIGWVLCAVGLLWALAFVASAYAGYGLKAHPGAVPGAAAANWFQSWTFFPALGLILVYVPLLFPHGRSLGGRWRIVGWTGALGIALVAAVFAFEPGTLSDGLGGFPNPYGILPASLAVGFALAGFPLTLGSAVAAATSMVLRLRRSRGAEREQLKWIAFAAAILVAAFACHLTLQLSGLEGRVAWYWVVWGAALCGIPTAAGIAILRRGLFDIDIVINRTLVYALLTGFVAGGYVLLVAGAGSLVDDADGIVLPLLATGVVAVAFQPLREQVQRGVNRLLYGERDDPYGVLARLGRRLEGTLAPDEILPTIVRTLTEALKLPYAAVFLDQEGVATLAAAAGGPVAGCLRLPLTYQAESVGELVVGPRSPGDAFGSADRRLLGDLALQVGVAAHAVRLTADLQRSRERLVSAREEERRRLRRDLHDGLGAQLAALTIQAGTLRATITRDPAAADAQVVELRRELRAAIGDIRRLVHGLRPPALDELGLARAVRERAARFAVGGVDAAAGDLRVAVEVPEELPPLPAAVEVAVFRIVEEALTNVVRHAAARCGVVRLAVGDGVDLDVTDDGGGLAPTARAGVGLASMRERAAELGGTCTIAAGPDGRGTRVSVRLPLPLRTDGAP